MGKRSTSTTKSGKFMNPTDQARKEARRRELKKNKKQRLLVRQAVLKGKDPATIFAELEKIDQMEFNPIQTAPLSDKVLKEKRKKLRDTLNRIMRLYEKEDSNLWTQIKSMEVQYEKRRAELIIYCESVKHTQSVNLEEIPLPNFDSGTGSSSFSSNLPHPPHGILKKISAFGEFGRMFKKPPGVPSVPPPEIYDIWDEGDAVVVEPGIPGIDDEEEDLPPYHTYYEFLRPPPVSEIELPSENKEEEENEMDEDDESEEDEDGKEEQNDEEPAQKVDIEPPIKPTSLQQRMLAIAGQDVDSFMKEMEVVHRQRELNRQANLETRLARLEQGQTDEVVETGDFPPARTPQMPPYQHPVMLPSFPLGPPPVYNGFVPPPPPGARLPPGPPPRLPPGLPPRMVRPAGMPPPPPPGIRPTGTTLTARPQISGAQAKPGKSTAATIEAKPQMRNLSADLTRFVPTTLKLKKETIPKKDVPKTTATPHIEWRISQPQATVNKPQAAPTQPPLQTKDDAYSQFMKELQGLM